MMYTFETTTKLQKVNSVILYEAIGTEENPTLLDADVNFIISRYYTVRSFCRRNRDSIGESFYGFVTFCTVE